MNIGRIVTKVGLTMLMVGTIASGCQCGETQPGLRRTGPKIHLPACTDPATQNDDGTEVGGYENCAITFAQADLSVRTLEDFVVNNHGEDALAIVGIEFLNDDNFSYSVDKVISLEEPHIIPRRTYGSTLPLSFRPLQVGDESAVMRIYSNSVNLDDEFLSDWEYLPEGQNATESIYYLDVELGGSGVDNGLPKYDSDTENCDFGYVAIGGGSATCDLLIANVSTETNPLRVKPLRIEGGELRLDDGEGMSLPVVPEGSTDPDVFRFMGNPPNGSEEIYPEAFEPDDETLLRSITLSFGFFPDALGIFHGEALLYTNDPANVTVPVLLDGVGVEAPVCEIRVKSVNGVDYDLSGDAIVPPIEPLDDVVLSVETSSPSPDADTLVAADWSVIARPSDSRIELGTPHALFTGFVDQTPQRRPGVDTAGPYVIGARVQDSLGVWSVNACRLEFDARPRDGFLAQLTWDSRSDQDLHVALMKDGGFCQFAGDPSSGDLSGACEDRDNPGDCYFGNCQGGADRCLDWDDNGENGSEGDICLDRDNVQAFGPENTNIDSPILGQSYLVSVDAFSGDAYNTVKIFLYGELAFERSREMDSSDWDEFAIVHWPDDEMSFPCIEDLSTQEDECPEYSDRM